MNTQNNPTSNTIIDLSGANLRLLIEKNFKTAITLLRGATCGYLVQLEYIKKEDYEKLGWQSPEKQHRIAITSFSDLPEELQPTNKNRQQGSNDYFCYYDLGVKAFRNAKYLCSVKLICKLGLLPSGTLFEDQGILSMKTELEKAILDFQNIGEYSAKKASAKVLEIFKGNVGNLPTSIVKGDSSQFVRVPVQVSVKYSEAQFLNAVECLLRRLPTVTTLDVKKELRSQGFWATQQNVSISMSQAVNSLGLNVTFNGIYRTFKKTSA